VTRPPAVAGTFADPAAAAAAIRALRAAGLEVRASMAAPFPEVLAALGGEGSRVGRAAAAGALAGAALGALLTVGGSLSWPIATGGKPIVSLPPFAVVVFEVAILAGSLATLAALAAGCWRGRAPRGLPPAATPGGDRIGVLAEGGDAGGAESILRARGAEEVRRVA
jgi:hypothetical protein